MNKKKTNYLVAILNVITVISMCVLFFSTQYLMNGMLTGPGEDKSIYDSFIIETLVNNVQLIMVLVYGGTGILNIICAIQNRKNKKICFWQLAFGVVELYGIVTSNIFFKKSDVIEWGDRIVYGIIPILLAIINLILIRKNKPKIIQIISYIAVIIIAALYLLGILGAYWGAICLIMLFIYIHKQDKYIEESKLRKISNIILYWILQFAISIGFLIMIISSLLITKVNDVKLENKFAEIYNNILTLPEVHNKDIYIPVEKNKKYGFINESGDEKISCQYDKVTYFFNAKVDKQECYVALAKNENKYYIITKNNQKIDVSDNLYLKRLESFMGEEFGIDEEKNPYRQGIIEQFSFVLQAFFSRTEIESEKQVKNDDYSHEIKLQEQNSKFYYRNRNYTMILEPTEDSEYDVIGGFFDGKFNVTIRKNNGEEEKYVEYIPNFDDFEEPIIITYSDGSILFKSLDEKTQGWYDINGNKIVVSADYEIIDIKDNKIFLKKYDKKINYFILDMADKKTIKTDALMILDDIYLIQKENKQMVLWDSKFKEISDEYDKIIPNATVDISEGFNSYWEDIFNKKLEENRDNIETNED